MSKRTEFIVKATRVNKHGEKDTHETSHNDKELAYHKAKTVANELTSRNFETGVTGGTVELIERVIDDSILQTYKVEAN